ncbi:MAG: hypothetical protein R3B06_20480 [Kofleriaceae bacterium]
MSNDAAFVSCRITVEHDLGDAAAFARGFAALLSDLRLTPGKVLIGKKARALKPDLLVAGIIDGDTQNLAVWNPETDGALMHLYLRAGDQPGIEEFTDRGSAVVGRASSMAALERLVALLHRHFGLLSANVAGHSRHTDAEKEAVRQGVAGTWPPEVVDRIAWDAMKWRRARTKLIRLSPITIIGPAIWATLPPMPAFDPMPRVTDLGDCKVLTAWPTLCEPRDPAFLRATRDLRAWLWPFTIQNPADHVDNDPAPVS